MRAPFKPYRKVERVNLARTDTPTGWRGFAFVETADPAEAERVIAAMNGVNLEGRPLNVNKACPKTQGGRGGFSCCPHGGGRQRRAARW